MIRVPLSRAEGLSCSITERLLAQPAQGPFLLLADFYRRVQRQPSETELFGFAVGGHPLELFADMALYSYCPVSSSGEHVVEMIVMQGLVGWVATIGSN